MTTIRMPRDGIGTENLKVANTAPRQTEALLATPEYPGIQPEARPDHVGPGRPRAERRRAERRQGERRKRSRPVLLDTRDTHERRAQARRRDDTRNRPNGIDVYT